MVDKSRRPARWRRGSGGRRHRWRPLRGRWVRRYLCHHYERLQSAIRSWTMQAPMPSARDGAAGGVMKLSLRGCRPERSEFRLGDIFDRERGLLALRNPASATHASRRAIVTPRSSVSLRQVMVVRVINTEAFTILTNLRQDIAFAVRTALRAPASTVAIVITLALGLAVNAVMFDVVDRLLLSSPSGVGDPDAVSRIGFSGRTAPSSPRPTRIISHCVIMSGRSSPSPALRTRIFRSAMGRLHGRRMP